MVKGGIEMSRNDSVLLILNVLMRYERPLSTTALMDIVGCDRKTVYKAVDRLETSGFPINVIYGREVGPAIPNTYQWTGKVVGF